MFSGISRLDGHLLGTTRRSLCVCVETIPFSPLSCWTSLSLVEKEQEKKGKQWSSASKALGSAEAIIRLAFMRTVAGNATWAR